MSKQMPANRAEEIRNEVESRRSELTSKAGQSLFGAAHIANGGKPRSSGWAEHVRSEMPSNRGSRGNGGRA